MQSLRCFSSNLVNVRFPGKPSIQDYLQISGCFDPLDLPSEEPKAMGVRDAPPWRIEQHYHTLIWQRCLQQESYFSYPLHTFYCRYTIKFHPLPHIPVIICTHNKVTVSLFLLLFIFALTARSYRDCHLLGMSNCRIQISLSSVGLHPK